MLTPVIIIVLITVMLSWSWRRMLRAGEAANVADWGAPWLNRLDGLNRIFCRRFHRLLGQSLRLPSSGAALLASNHISGLDPLLLIAASPRPLRFVIAREQYDRWWLRWLFHAVGCIPVERSRNPRAALRAARQALEAGEVVALFPHGGIHLDHYAPAALKRGVALLAQTTGAPIYPVRVSGVRGQGLTVAAVFMPSRVRLRKFAPLHCHGDKADACLERLWDILSVRTRARRRENPHRSPQPDKNKVSKLA